MDVRAINDPSKVTVLCCEATVGSLGYWPLKPDLSLPFVYELLKCPECNNHIKLLAPFKKCVETGPDTWEIVDD